MCSINNLNDGGDEIFAIYNIILNFLDRMKILTLNEIFNASFFFTILGSVIAQSYGAKNDIRSNHVFQFDFACNIL